jgi:hypothetical protein
MPGLDPGIHDDLQPGQTFRFLTLKVVMDCRVSPLRGGPAMTGKVALT